MSDDEKCRHCTEMFDRWKVDRFSAIAPTGERFRLSDGRADAVLSIGHAARRVMSASPIPKRMMTMVPLRKIFRDACHIVFEHTTERDQTRGIAMVHMLDVCRYNLEWNDLTLEMGSA